MLLVEISTKESIYSSSNRNSQHVANCINFVENLSTKLNYLCTVQNKKANIQDRSQIELIPLNVDSQSLIIKLLSKVF